MTSPRAILRQLQNGNQRFAHRVSKKISFDQLQVDPQLVEEHQPQAVVLGCSDARVPVEIVFDQKLGSLFVIRVAGNIVAPSQLGSVEFAVSQLGVRLVVVLGHSKCGAVQATIQSFRNTRHLQKSNNSHLSFITNSILPSIGSLLEAHRDLEDQTLLSLAVRENIQFSLRQLKTDSCLLKKLAQTDELLMVGAEYRLETGTVDFFD